MLFAKEELNPGLQILTSPSDRSTDEGHIESAYNQSQKRLISKAKHKDYFKDHQLFITQVHITENFCITELKSNMRTFLII